MGAVVSKRRRSQETTSQQPPASSNDGAMSAPAGAPAPPPPAAAADGKPPAPPSLLARIPLEHAPASHTVHAALFRSVANAGFLHAQLLARNAAFEYAFVDASALASTTHLLAAVFRAVTAAAAAASSSSSPPAGLRTPNVHSEAVFCLAPSPNIAEAYRRFGISPASRDVVAVKVLTAGGSSTAAADDVWAHLCASVEGTAVPFTDENVALCTDWAKVRRYYKLNGAAALAGIKDDGARRREEEMLILGAMALRGV
ncbi:hypothetical protein RB595_001987 [Gaeumannomyces hyphopodioides]